MHTYLILETYSGKDRIYVGKRTKTWKESQKYWGSGSRIKSSIKEHGLITDKGKKNFLKFILDPDEAIHTITELNASERKWILILDANNKETGFNLTSGGESGKPNAETKKKMGEKSKNTIPFRNKKTGETGRCSREAFKEGVSNGILESTCLGKIPFRNKETRETGQCSIKDFYEGKEKGILESASSNVNRGMVPYRSLITGKTGKCSQEAFKKGKIEAILESTQIGTVPFRNKITKETGRCSREYFNFGKNKGFLEGIQANKTFSDKSRKNISEAVKKSQNIKITCPYCNKTGNGNPFKINHFDNCIQNPDHPNSGINLAQSCYYCGKISTPNILFRKHFNKCILNPQSQAIADNGNQ